MKSVLILRHAKSSWGDSSLADHERPLAPRGVRAAERMGRYIAASKPTPDLVVCSSALRAQQTLAHVLSHLESDLRVETEPAVYGASPETLLAKLREIDDASRSVLLIGHEPAVSELSCLMSASDGSNALRRLARGFPTAALAELRFDVARWAELEPGAGTLRRFVRPKDLD